MRSWGVVPLDFCSGKVKSFKMYPTNMWGVGPFKRQRLREGEGEGGDLVRADARLFRGCAERYHLLDDDSRLREGRGPEAGGEVVRADAGRGKASPGKSSPPS